MPIETSELPFERYVRSTLIKAICTGPRPYLTLGGHGKYDILTFSTTIIETYQWRSLYCRPIRSSPHDHKRPRNAADLLCIGEATSVELREALTSAGLGTVFTVNGTGLYRKLDDQNRSAWIFDPQTSEITCKHTIDASSPTPDWTSFNTYIRGKWMEIALSAQD